MIESQRRAYLEVMGYDIWSAKLPEPESDRLLIQPGQGETLLICSGLEVTDSRFTGDIVRALGEQVVWAWPDPEGGPGSPTVEEAVGQHLFTRVVVFGAGLLGQLYKGEVPIVVGSARILATHSIEGLAASGSARRAFWNQVCGKINN